MPKKRKITSIEALGILPSMHVSLYHDRAKLERDLRSRGVDIPLETGCDAQTFVAEIGGTPINFVLMEESDETLWSQLSLLAHEATHIAVRYLRSFGEEEPGSEELAYAVQAAAGCLFDMHLSWLEKKGKTNGRK